MKGRITIPQFDDLPYNYFHTLYKKYVDYLIEESKKTDEQRGGEALGQALSDL